MKFKINQVVLVRFPEGYQLCKLLRRVALSNVAAWEVNNSIFPRKKALVEETNLIPFTHDGFLIIHQSSLDITTTPAHVIARDLITNTSLATLDNREQLITEIANYLNRV